MLLEIYRSYQMLLPTLGSAKPSAGPSVQVATRDARLPVLSILVAKLSSVNCTLEVRTVPDAIIMTHWFTSGGQPFGVLWLATLTMFPAPVLSIVVSPRLLSYRRDHVVPPSLDSMRCIWFSVELRIQARI